MILNFGKYIFDDGIKNYDGTKSQMINVSGNTTNTVGNINIYQQYAFNEQYYNSLLNSGKLQDAVDYISRYRPIDEEKRRIFDADVATLRQQAKYENNFRANLTQDQLNRYNFYNGVFQDRGLDGLQDNPYAKKFESIKRNIGSVTTFDKDGNLVVEKEATGLKIFFPNTKRVNKWVDWLTGSAISDPLQADTHNGIDNFLDYSNLTKNQLREAGINIEYDNTGSAYISFSKANELANELIYKYYNFYTNNWDENELGRHWNPYIAGLDEDGNVINQGYIYNPTEDDKFYSNDILYKGINSIVSRFEVGDYATNREFKNNMRAFANMISENENISNKLEEMAGLTEHDYSSVESDFISDAMQEYITYATQSGLTQEQMLQGMKYIHASDVDKATKSIDQHDKDFYFTYDDNVDSTLIKAEDPDDIKEIIQRLHEADPNDVNLTTLVSNGIIGTKISIARKADKKGETGSGKRGLQIWVPELFMEEAQKRLNEDPKNRAVLEVNTILDTNSTYTLRNGTRISADSDDQFYIESGRIDVNGKAGYMNTIPISKEEAALQISKDIMIDNAINAQMNSQIAPSGKIINIEDYEAEAKLHAAEIAQELYPGVDTLKKTDGTLITPEEIFTKQININNISPYVYSKINLIYEVYDTLMRELYSYGDFQDALLNLGRTRYDYSINS